MRVIALFILDVAVRLKLNIITKLVAKFITKDSYLLLCYKPLDTTILDTLFSNDSINKNFNVIHASSPWGSPPPLRLIYKYVFLSSVALIWGEFKGDAPVFISLCQRYKIPYLIMERSPLLKNGVPSIYVDDCGTTNFAAYWNPNRWNKLVENGLDKNAIIELENYKLSLQRNSIGVDVQKASFESKSQISHNLSIPLACKIIYCPLQVNHDVVIVNKASSPWIHNMNQFIELINKYAYLLPKNYHVVIKDHPRNIWEGNPTQYNGKAQTVSFVSDEINSNALVQACDVLLTINSGVGTEAMVFRKKVISLGNSFYSDKGINILITNEKEFQKTFAEIDLLSTDAALMDIYAYNFFSDFTFDLSDTTDANRFVKRLKAKLNILLWQK